LMADASAVLKRINSGQVQPVYLCWGRETYLMEQLIQAVIGQKAGGEFREFAVQTYSMLETPLQQILDDAETAPFLVPHKVIVARDAHLFTGASVKSKAEHDADRLLDYVKSPAEHSVVIFVVETDKLDERKKIVKEMIRLGFAVPFPVLNARELQAWVEQRAKELNIRLEPEAAEYVLLNVSGHLQQLSGELDKLADYCGPGGRVTLHDAQQLISRSAEYHVFMLVDEVVNRKIGSALRMLHELLEQKEEPVKIIALLARQFRIVLQARELAERGAARAQIAAQVGIPPFAVQKALDQGMRYSSRQISSILSQLADLDHAIKTGQLDKTLGLELFLMKLAG